MARINRPVSSCSPHFPVNLIRDLPQLRRSTSCCTGLSWAELGLLPACEPAASRTSPAQAGKTRAEHWGKQRDSLVLPGARRGLSA